MAPFLQHWKEDTEPWYVAIGVANLIMGTSSVLIPLMVVHVLHGSVATVGLLASLASLVGVVGSLVWGRLSDAAHRRKPFVLLSFTAVGLSFAGIALSHSLGMLLLHNMVLNFFWVANAAVTVLIVIENKQKSLWERRIGQLNQIGALGWAAGLVLGSVALAGMSLRLSEETSTRVLFMILAAGAACATFLSLRWIPHPSPRFAERRFFGTILAMGNFLVERARFAPYHLYHYLNLRRLPNLLWNEEGLRRETKRFLLATLLAFTAMGFFAVPLPILLSERFGLAPSMVFAYFIVSSVTTAAAYPFASRRIHHTGNKAVHMGALAIRFVLFVATAAFLALSTTPPPPFLIVLFFLLLGGTWSFFQLSGVALASHLAKPRFRGQVLGLYNAFAGVGTIVAGVGSGYLATYGGYQSTFAASAFLIALCLVILYPLPAPSPSSTNTEDAPSIPVNHDRQ
jgi:MFS family permease